MNNNKLKAIIDDWLKDFSDSTRESYSRIVLNFFNQSGINEVNQISLIMIDQWLIELKVESQNTQHTKIETIKSFFNYIFQERLIRVNYSEIIQSVQMDRKEKKFLDLADFQALVQIAKSKSAIDYQLIMSIYLDRKKVSDVANEYKIPRQTINAKIRKYHPIATPEMIKNSLDVHARDIAAAHFKQCDPSCNSSLRDGINEPYCCKEVKE